MKWITETIIIMTRMVPSMELIRTYTQQKYGRVKDAANCSHWGNVFSKSYLLKHYITSR